MEKLALLMEVNPLLGPPVAVLVRFTWFTWFAWFAFPRNPARGLERMPERMEGAEEEGGVVPCEEEEEEAVLLAFAMGMGMEAK